MVRESGDREGQVDHCPGVVSTVQHLQEVECGVVRAAALPAGRGCLADQLVEVSLELIEGFRFPGAGIVKHVTEGDMFLGSVLGATRHNPPPGG
ncbi:hypothetical protein GCM10027258_83320 [Amycolatopsis stemonae]